MPYSHIWSVPPVINWVTALAPASVLDIGIGFGKFGLLLRESLEVAHNRYHRQDWQVRIDGVEIFPDYRTPLWDYAYDQVHLGPVQDVLPTLGRYDVTLLCDVIEHFDKPAARALLDDLLDRSRLVIITTPLLFWPQGAAFDNQAERHLSYFTPLDFRHLQCRFAISGGTLLVLASRQPLPARVAQARVTSLGMSTWFIKEAAKVNLRELCHERLPTPLKAPLKRMLRLLAVN